MSARRLSARALWGLASWALPLAVIFLVTPSLLRLLGAERFGMLMICFVTPLLAVQLDCVLHRRFHPPAGTRTVAPPVR